MRYAERLQNARRAMQQHDVDLLFLTPSANMQYLTGIPRERGRQYGERRRELIRTGFPDSF